MSQCELVDTGIAYTGMYWGQDFDKKPRHGLCLIPHGRVCRLQMEHQVVRPRVCNSTLSTVQRHAHTLHGVLQQRMKITSLHHQLYLG